MVGVDPETGTSAARIWIASGAAALLAAAAVLAFTRSRINDPRSLMRSGLIVIGAVLATSLVWSFFDRGTVRDHDADRRALEMRAEELTVRALAPGSALACLDALAGESVETACEKALFASPESVAAAVSYAAARMALLADVVAYSKRGGSDVDGVLLPLRRSLETDRFGFIAHALAARDGCTSQDCKALALLHDPSRVRANLSGATLDRYLDHYVTAWAQPADTPVADDTRGQPGAVAQAGGPGQRKVVVNIDFPTAASIPPVSIMNPEPATKPPAYSPAGAAASATGAASGKKGRKQGANQPADLPPQEPVYLPGAAATAPASPAPETTTATTAAPTQAAAPAANLASGPSAPVQLNPFPSHH